MDILPPSLFFMCFTDSCHITIIAQKVVLIIFKHFAIISITCSRYDDHVKIEGKEIVIPFIIELAPVFMLELIYRIFTGRNFLPFYRSEKSYPCHV